MLSHHAPQKEVKTRKLWKPNALLCSGRRLMFQCAGGDQTQRQLLVSFDKTGVCRARWAPGASSASACSWVDAIWAMSQLPPSKTLDVPSSCLRFLDGRDSRTTDATPIPCLAERIDRVLADDCFAVCGLRWTGHSLTAHVRRKTNSTWESVSILPGLAPAFFAIVMKAPSLNPNPTTTLNPDHDPYFKLTADASRNAVHCSHPQARCIAQSAGSPTILHCRAECVSNA